MPIIPTSQVFDQLTLESLLEHDQWCRSPFLARKEKGIIILDIDFAHTARKATEQLRVEINRYR